MQSLWNDQDVVDIQDNPLELRVYTSRLLGQNPDLVLHGGGNTSVKAKVRNLFGDEEDILYVKGSGWNLGTIQAAGFAPVKLDLLQRMATLDHLSDTDMVTNQRAAMTNPNAPNPSVEAILHAIIPFTYVDHTHADAVVTITNSPNGEQRIRELYGPNMLIVPYVMPGFILAKTIYEMTENDEEVDWDELTGMVLLGHGVFTFADNAKESYERMIEIVTQAEEYLAQNAVVAAPTETASSPDLLGLATLRQAVSQTRGTAVLAQLDDSPESLQFANRADVASLATRGPLTPDHVIRTKRIAAIIGDDLTQSIADYVTYYHAYFERNTDGELTVLDPAPRWAVWPGQGTLAFGRNVKENTIITDIKAHTQKALQQSESLGAWQALPETDIFEVEYWELEQAKLRRGGTPPVLQGKIALVTGAANGIGKACVESLVAQGAVVAALDIQPQITETFSSGSVLGVACDVTDDAQLQAAVEATVKQFGGLDILILNAGIFPKSAKIADMPADAWDKSMAVNLTSQQRLLQIATPYLKRGVGPAVVFIASKNVPAPGPGASAYSVAKAGTTQLARIAALELGKDGIRVNVLHPNAVFDTALWTDDILQQRAKHYGLTVQEYKTNNVLRVEVHARDVADLACAMVGPLFSRTTGAQLPIDGGNERVI